MIFRLGLNPYGLTYTLGLQSVGTARANRTPAGFDGFFALASRVGAQTLEVDWRWFTATADDDLARVADRAEAAGMTVIYSTWLRHESGETLDEARRVARGLRAALIRMHLAPVLEGARAALGGRWPALVAHARTVLVREAARCGEAGLRIGIENHQDFGSEELLDLADEAGSNVGLVLDTGNPFAVGEDPVAFTNRIAHRLFHVHLKDYRAQFTDEGYRLVRCAIGDGCVPFEEMATVIAARTPGLPITASLEPAALDARHVRLFTAGWWQGYPPRRASELATALGRLRRRRYDDDADGRTPWERHAPHDELLAYEADHLSRSVAFVKRCGWLP